MTGDELRRQADHLRRVALSRERAAGVLVGVVRSIEGTSPPLISRSRAAWACRAATGFERQLRLEGSRLDEIVEDLRHVVNRLLTEADGIRAEARTLEARADAIELESVASGPL